MAKKNRSDEASISLCMIVKDEEEFLPQCLKSVEKLVDEIIVVDTGSTDRTMEIARKFDANVIETDWIDDFSAVRNISFEAAAGDWILWLDADEVLEEGAEAAIRQAVKDPELDAYMLTVVNLQGESTEKASQQSFPSPRLVRNHPARRFKGIIHEQIQFDETKSGSIGELSVRVIHFGYLDPIMTDRDKVARNQELLSKIEGDDPQVLVLAADAEMEAGRLDEALKKYEQAYEALAERTPMNLSGIVLKIVICYRTKKDSSAVFHWAEKGLRQWPDYTDLEYLRGLTRLENNDFNEAITSFAACAMMGEAPGIYDTQVGEGAWYSSTVCSLMTRSSMDARRGSNRMSQFCVVPS